MREDTGLVSVIVIKEGPETYLIFRSHDGVWNINFCPYMEDCIVAESQESRLSNEASCDNHVVSPSPPHLELPRLQPSIEQPVLTPQLSRY